MTAAGGGPARIVQLANFVTPTSGGIRTAMARLREGYRAAGHDAAALIPGDADAVDGTDSGTVVTCRAPILPGSGGYRVLVDLPKVLAAVERLAPDRLEVHDRSTLRAVGTWARCHGVPAVVVVHERLDQLAARRLPWVVRSGPAVRRDNAAVARRFDRVVVPSRWAAQEFSVAGVDDVAVVGWGVDLQRFSPDRRSPVLRRRLLDGGQALLALVCRLSPEKRPDTALALLAAVRRVGVDARLVVAGTGSSDRRMRRAARGLPVTFLGHLRSRDQVADLLAAADLVVCPGPVETFGLAALEALASGTPVVGVRSGAVPELLAPAYGEAAGPHGPAMAVAAGRLLGAGVDARRAARSAAERHPWPRAVARMLALHGLSAVRAPVAAGRPDPAR